ncbi:4-amino-4-deoxy-L-arabinose transferase [Longilinea arvoryzae]|uniref:4-amino-4-deoxy-L-arabinose transferase n=1 Tax=Longilinea arvoryzae TaxID=360412 RepID=A0A0S7B6Z5_9CHLR|nr:glycosyltransferase family 39 protein [Longilinea arvoryzae]GAP13023.1 4-amino-4-deoxy-L-arabinose transferase [Longilinea arvoryzae]
MTLALRKLRENILPILLFSVFLIAGLSIYRDYGVSWDEPLQRDIGVANLRFILGHEDPLVSMADRFYGPFFELFLLGAELKFFPPASHQDIYFLRHLLTFLTFFVGTVFFYILSKRIFKNAITALLCTAALILSPRIFDNAFYNTKDIPLLVFFIISFTFFMVYVDTRKFVYLIFLAVSSAITTTIRLAGLLIPFLTVLTLIVGFMRSPEGWKKKMRAGLPKLALFLLLFAFFSVLFWPILWKNPIGNFILALNEFSHFRWNLPVLFMGTSYSATELPWFYSIVWILISTPIFYSVLFFTGAIKWIAGIHFTVRGFFENQALKLLAIAAWFFVPLLLVIFLKSVLYDSWRHLFFIYPAFLLLAFWGFEKTLAQLSAKFGRFNVASLGLILILGATFVSTAVFMIQAHPYEQLYFNRLAGGNLADLKSRYELDYWGLSYRQGLEYISRTDPSPVIDYISETTPGGYTFILPEADEKRLNWLGIEADDQARYLIINYRWKKSYPSEYREVYSVELDGAKILSVFKLR